jgi:hypothetical protein
MPGVTDGQIAAARSVDLLSYLQSHEPGSLRKSGPGEYCLVEHDSLKISNGKWFWFSRGVGSNNALDFLIQVRGLGFAEAVGTLADGRAAPTLAYTPLRPAQVLPRKPFVLPPPNTNNHRAIAYLMGRGISRDIIGACILADTLYESRTQHNCVFVGKDGEGRARFACERGTTGDYKKDVTGSDKRYSFAIPARDSPDLYVFEAPADLLSFATIRHGESPEDWHNAHYLSLGGVSALALEQYLTGHPEVKNTALCLDNDMPGRAAAERISTMLEAKGLRVSVLPPPSGKDWNNHLQNTIREQTAINTPARAKDAGISL